MKTPLITILAGSAEAGALIAAEANALIAAEANALIAAEANALIAIAAARPLPLALKADEPLPAQFVWMPKGEHEISAFAADGKRWAGKVTCDAAGAKACQEALARVLAAGRRCYLDENHEDAGATAWVLGFAWDAERGIVVRVEWTSLGEELLRGKVYHSFSPAFLLNRDTGRVSGFPAGHAAGGLVNAPAFGAAMPALIAARLASAEKLSVNHPASDGLSDNQNKTRTMNRKLLTQILAALSVEIPAEATDEQVQALAAKHIDPQTLQAKLAELDTLKAKDAEIVALKAREAQRRQDDAKTLVEAAVARGALPAKDETIQAKWRGLIVADPTHAELLKALPSNPALERVTTPGGHIAAKDGAIETLKAYAAEKDVLRRGTIYAKDIAPLFKPGFQLGPILASNSLGTLSGELITQRSLSLLKRRFPSLFAISTDFSADAAKFGQTVQTRLRTIPSVTSYSTETGYATSAAGATDVPVVINAHRAVQISFNANELASTNRDLFGEQVEGAHNAIGADLVDALLAIITAANFGDPTLTTTVALNNFARSSVTGVAKKLTNRKVPSAGRFLMLNPDYYEKIGQDTSIVSLATYQQAQIITENQLPRIGGLQPYEVESFPTTGNLVGFAGAADALALATRVPNDYAAAMPDVASGGSVQIVSNLDTGISVMLVRFVDHLMGAAYWRLAYMRGAAKGQVNSGERIISATPS